MRSNEPAYEKILQNVRAWDAENDTAILIFSINESDADATRVANYLRNNGYEVKKIPFFHMHRLEVQRKN